MFYKQSTVRGPQSAVRVLYWPAWLDSIEFDKIRLPNSLNGYVRI